MQSVSIVSAIFFLFLFFDNSIASAITFLKFNKGLIGYWKIGKIW